MHTTSAIGRFSASELSAFVADNVSSLLEDEALAVLDNAHCAAAVCGTLARNPRLTAFYSVRLRLVQHRATPLTHAVKLVHYLHWPDLVRTIPQMRTYVRRTTRDIPVVRLAAR